MSHPDLYGDVWTLDKYGDFSPGLTFLRLFEEMLHPEPGAHIFDVGTGDGAAARALRDNGFRVTAGDWTDVGWQKKADANHDIPFLNLDLTQPATVVSSGYLYCCDVLEHIPTEYVMAVLERLMAGAKRGVFLSIATQPDVFGVWVGQSLHETVKPFVWWRDRITRIAHAYLGQVEARDLGQSAIFAVRYHE